MRTSKMVYFSMASNKMPVGSATKNTLQYNMEFAREMGFRTVVARKSHINPLYYARLLNAWLSADIFLTLYPHLCQFWPGDSPIAMASRALDKGVISALRRRSPRIGSILYLFDLPLHQRIAYKQSPIHRTSYELEKTVFEAFDILCVFNANMRNAIVRQYGISEERFVESEMPSYRVNFRPPLNKSIDTRMWRIALIGNLDRNYVGDWMIRDLPSLKGISYEFIGPNGNWMTEIARSDVTNCGPKNREELASYLSRTADFGIIAYAGGMKEYFESTVPSKVGAYVTAGLPILVPSDWTYLAYLVNKYGIGMTFHSFDQLPIIIEGLSWSEYDDMRKRCLLLAEQMREGYFFKRTVKAAMSKLGLT